MPRLLFEKFKFRPLTLTNLRLTKSILTIMKHFYKVPLQQWIYSTFFCLLASFLINEYLQHVKQCIKMDAKICVVQIGFVFTEIGG